MDVILEIFQQLSINLTVFIQLIFVFIMYLFCKFFLFNKLQEVIELRIEKTKKTEESASNLNEKFDVLKKEYDEKLEDTFRKVQDYKSLEKSKCDTELLEVYKREEKEVEEFVTKSKDAVAKEIAEYKDQVMSKSNELANELINKIKVQ